MKQALQQFIKANPNVRMIEPRFMEIRQAMGTAKGKLAGAAYLRAFIEEMKASGFVADALKRSGQHDATVAPAGGTSLNIRSSRWRRLFATMSPWF